MFETVIADLLNVSGVKGVYISDTDGTLIESESNAQMDDEMCAALFAEMFNRASEILEKLSSDPVDILVVEGKKGRILVSKVGNFILGVIADIKANYGLLRIEFKKALDKMAMMM
uniref:Roadblock/LAMTOR2 domain-containing protein n=1 Tax=Archaeoglobus fulgidus TaxID=2234 RepID=A0A7J2THY1_ARCFL